MKLLLRRTLVRSVILLSKVETDIRVQSFLNGYTFHVSFVNASHGSCICAIEWRY